MKETKVPGYKTGDIVFRRYSKAATIKTKVFKVLGKVPTDTYLLIYRVVDPWGKQRDMRYSELESSAEAELRLRRIRDKAEIDSAKANRAYLEFTADVRNADAFFPKV